jgi:radical SAM superfamily enzyme YgiQ (UPF0313 family)
MSSNEKTKVGLVQINNSFSGQNYFPYSIGVLQAYAQKHLSHPERFEFKTPVYKRMQVRDAVKKLVDSDIVFFSTYVWNFRLSSEIARRLKQEKPEIINVFGGCQVPRNFTEDFLASLPFVDICARGEGERAFNGILENQVNQGWGIVPSITYRSPDGKIRTNASAGRILDLSQVPSPYLAGVFNRLMQENPEENWLGLWETNRGCPYGCAYCEWGGEYHKKLVNHDLEKLLKEIDWFSENKIEFIFCCDSNFGIEARDLEIARKVADNKAKYGYPKALSVQNTKNSSFRTYQIQKVLSDSGLSKGVNLAFQSLHNSTLEAIGRKNISNKDFYELQTAFNADGIETFSDIILALPEETYETFARGVESLINSGQRNRIQFNNLSLLPNSEMSSQEFQEKYGLQSVETALVNIHGSLENEEVPETQRLVIGTRAMPPEKWVDARAFGWMMSFLYFDKILQIPMTLLKKYYNIGYSEVAEAFLKSDKKESPLIESLGSFFIQKAKSIQAGDSEFCESKKWLNIWWPADELALIETCAEGRLPAFYQESQGKLEKMLEQRGFKDKRGILPAGINLNRHLIKLPFQSNNLILHLPFNIWEFYKSQMQGNPINLLVSGDYRYLIDRNSEKWDSWEDWCRRVVWYGNKRGAYMYECAPVAK